MRMGLAASLLGWACACAGPGQLRPAQDPAEEQRQLRAESRGPPPGVGPALDLEGLPGFDIPMVVTPEVHAWASYWAGDGCRSFSRRLERAERRRLAVERALSSRGLPRDLAALPLIESGHLPTVESEAGAVGEWQLTAPTAQSLGLRVDPGLDERRDPDRSAEAGATYLATLSRRFPDPYLAWAAYNAGPEAVAKAVREAGGVADYWTLARSGRLSAEAANYVPKILAAAILRRDPVRFGLSTCAVRKP